MRKLALTSLLLAIGLQLVPASLLAQSPDGPAVEPLVATEELPAAEVVVPEEDPAAAEIMEPVSTTEEGPPTEDRLSIGESVRGTSQVTPARGEIELPEPETQTPQAPAAQEEEPTTVPDEEEPDEEEFSEEFPEEEVEPEPEPEPEPEEPETGGTAGGTFIPTPAPEVSSLPSTGLDALSLALFGIALLMAGTGLRQAIKPS